MEFVVDCSMALAWFFPDEATSRTLQAKQLLNAGTAFVPHLWAIELSNVLALAERKGRTTVETRRRWLSRVLLLPITPVQYSAADIFNRVLPLAVSENLTVYDAVYLDLAITRNVALATLDQPLAAAAKRAGLTVL